ncbi:MAG: hypothetical protein JO112_09805 [Planctomycetes bacterium]|nr:hypothetical protein [Planctomycetota bacterium]
MLGNEISGAFFFLTLAGTMGLALALGFYLVVRDSVRHAGKWGINFQGLPGGRCPGCERSLPVVRVPSSVHQALWGGWTCTQCGCEIDKWGQKVSL